MADVAKTLNGLNCCKNSYPKDCKHCPYEKDCTHHETCDILIRNAISVITEQQAEIERLKRQKETLIPHCFNVDVEALLREEGDWRG